MSRAARVAMTVLAVLVAIYALVASAVPAARQPLIVELMTAMPATALAHFVFSAIALAIGPFQLSTRLRVRRLELHRWLGRVYIVAVIIGGGSGVVMGARSEGGTAAHVGFMMLGALWVLTAVFAYLRIREYDVEEHRRWMLRSYALAFAAVTLRLQLPIFIGAFGIPFEDAYPAIAWSCWVPNLLFVEWWILRRPAATGMESAAV